MPQKGGFSPIKGVGFSPKSVPFFSPKSTFLTPKGVGYSLQGVLLPKRRSFPPKGEDFFSQRWGFFFPKSYFSPKVCGRIPPKKCIFFPPKVRGLPQKSGLFAPKMMGFFPKTWDFFPQIVFFPKKAVFCGTHQTKETPHDTVLIPGVRTSAATAPPGSGGSRRTRARRACGDPRDRWDPPGSTPESEVREIFGGSGGFGGITGVSVGSEGSGSYQRDLRGIQGTWRGIRGSWGRSEGSGGI